MLENGNIIIEPSHSTRRYCERSASSTRALTLCASARDRPDALVHVDRRGVDLEHPLVELLREDVIEDIELHRAPSLPANRRSAPPSPAVRRRSSAVDAGGSERLQVDGR
jgi:hypothetical protein